MAERVGEMFALYVTSEGSCGPMSELVTQSTSVMVSLTGANVLIQVFIGEKWTLQIEKHFRED